MLQRAIETGSKDHQPTADLLMAADAIGVRGSDRWLIHDVSLEVRRGEIVTMIGPNGGGKTTTIKALLGLIPVDTGTVHRNETCKIGYMPQKLTVDSSLPLTVRRFMELTNTLTTADLEHACQRTHIDHKLESHISTLSGGEFQRALLARAIARKPDVLILDEPVQGVDFTGIANLYALIASIRDELNCGVLMISHDLHLVMRQTDTVICINQHICCSGAPAAVTASPEYLDLFGPNAAEALAFYQHEHDHTHD